MKKSHCLTVAAKHLGAPYGHLWQAMVGEEDDEDETDGCLPDAQNVEEVTQGVEVPCRTAIT